MSLVASSQAYQGGMVGAVVGDAVGAPFERKIAYEPYLLNGLFREIDYLPYTDDTHMTIGIAEFLLERGQFYGAHMAPVFARNFAHEPWRGYAESPFQVLFYIVNGAHWEQASRALFNNSGSYGNGGAMRVAPIALVSTDLDDVATLAHRTALITHAHELGIKGAVLQDCSMALDLDSKNIGEGQFHEALGRYAFTDIYKKNWITWGIYSLRARALASSKWSMSWVVAFRPSSQYPQQYSAFSGGPTPFRMRSSSPLA
jgi:hypothetical protein